MRPLPRWRLQLRLPAAAAAAAAVAAAPVAVVSKASADWPEGTAMKTMTVREALREAMAEEMRADPTVLLMGEEVGEYQGAYKISPGPAGRVRAEAGGRYADHRDGLYRDRGGRGLGRV